MKFQVRPLSPARAEDFFTFFDHVAFNDHPEWGCGCYCCFFHATSREDWESRTPGENRDWARELIQTGVMRGLLAYDRQKPVGWCHYDLLKNLPGVRLYREGLSADDPDSAAIVCFTVAQGWRGQGVATRLLEAALADLKAQGVKRVEAYPVTEDDSQEHNFPGPVALYEKLGFTVARSTENGTLVEKRL
jgi:GNAT superfamily N-acetyltransferase